MADDKPGAAFGLSLAGGVLILLSGLVFLFIFLGIFGILAGVIIIIGALSGYANPDSAKAWGIVIIIMSVISLPSFGGFLIGLLLALVGGILFVTWAPPQPVTYYQPVGPVPYGQPAPYGYAPAYGYPPPPAPYGYPPPPYGPPPPAPYGQYPAQGAYDPYPQQQQQPYQHPYPQQPPPPYNDPYSQQPPPPYNDPYQQQPPPPYNDPYQQQPPPIDPYAQPAQQPNRPKAPGQQ